MTDKSEYIGKRLTWEEAVELFPFRLVSFKDCEMDGIDMKTGVLVDIIDDNDLNDYLLKYQDIYHIDRTIDGFSGGPIYGAIVESPAVIIEKFCEIHSDECNFYKDYSGRGMFGKLCVGITCKDNPFKTLVRLCDFMHERGVASAEDALGSICKDSLGKDTIIYFPNVNA